MERFEVMFLEGEGEDYRKFGLKLSKEALAKLTRIYWLLRSEGPRVGLPYARKIEQGLWELRVITKQHVRVLYAFRGRKIYFLNWFVKKTNQIPGRELEKARRKLTII